MTGPKKTKKRARHYLWHGRYYTQRGLARAAGIPRSTFRQRLANGMTVERALAAPSQRRPRFLWRRRLWTATALARAAGVTVASLRHRLKTGLPVTEAVSRATAKRRRFRPCWQGRRYRSLAALAAAVGVPENTLRTRIVKQGMSARAALAEPIRRCT
jgi:hypothetical protein